MLNRYSYQSYDKHACNIGNHQLNANRNICPRFCYGIHNFIWSRQYYIPALICFVIGNFLIRNSGDNLSSHAGGVLLFFTLFSCGSLIYQSGALGRLSDFLSGISYDVFLIHHVLLVQIVKIIPPFDTLFLNLIYLMFCIILIVVAAGVFSKIMKTIMQLKVFSDLDRQIIKRIG